MLRIFKVSKMERVVFLLCLKCAELDNQHSKSFFKMVNIFFNRICSNRIVQYYQNHLKCLLHQHLQNLDIAQNGDSNYFEMLHNKGVG